MIKLFKKCISILLLMICLSPGASFAQDAATPATTESSGSLSEFFNSIDKATSGFVNKTVGEDYIRKMKDAALTRSASLTDTALKLAGILALLTLLWELIMAMLSKQSVFVASLETILLGTICAALITNYTMVVDQVFNIAMGVLNDIGLDVAQTLKAFMISFADPISKVFSNWGSGSASWFSKVMTGGTIDMIGTLIISLAVAWLLLKAMVSLIGVLIVGPVYFGVGIIFGPIMIATMMSKVTKPWFETWLKFLIASAFMTTVAVAVVALMTSLFGEVAKSIGADGLGTLAMISLALLAASAAEIFAKVPSIADAMFPGKTGAGSAISKNPVATAAAATGAVVATAGKAAAVVGSGGMAVGGMMKDAGMKGLKKGMGSGGGGGKGGGSGGGGKGGGGGLAAPNPNLPRLG